MFIMTRKKLRAIIEQELKARGKAFDTLHEKGFIGLTVPELSEIKFNSMKLAQDGKPLIQYDGYRFAIVPLDVKTDQVLTEPTTVKAMLEFYGTTKFRFYMNVFEGDI